MTLGALQTENGGGRKKSVAALFAMLWSSLGRNLFHPAELPSAVEAQTGKRKKEKENEEAGRHSAMAL